MASRLASPYAMDRQSAALSDARLPHHIVIARGHTIHRLTLPPWAFNTACLALVLLTVWTVASTTFLLCRDGLVGAVMSRQAGMQYAYESRIATLRAELERVRTHSLVAQGSMTDRLDTLLRRQTSLETRQSIVGSLADLAGSAGLHMPAAPEPQPEPLVPPQPEPDVSEPAETGSLGAHAELQPAAATAVLARVERSLDGVDAHQSTALAALEHAAKARTAHIRDALDDVGLDADRLAARAARSGDSAEGGPYIPVALPADAGSFERQAYAVQAALAEASRLNGLLAEVPLRRPFAHADVTSGFGVRVDPFLGTAAMHPGIDFRQEMGSTVRVTAAGRVVQAGWTGGYGNMVEVDHGNGVATRYGHLSAILVTVGQHVALGQEIGRVGSTGRSTGPHLHYETRVNGEAVDPTRFIQAGARYADLL